MKWSVIGFLTHVLLGPFNVYTVWTGQMPTWACAAAWALFSIGAALGYAKEIWPQLRSADA